MIAVIYNNGIEEKYNNINLAKFMILTKLFESKGRVAPSTVVEVLGITTGGISVERDIWVNYPQIDLQYKDLCYAILS